MRYQSEVLSKDLEVQAEKMLEQVSNFQYARLTEMAEQVLEQRGLLLSAIAALRDLEN